MRSDAGLAITATQVPTASPPVVTTVAPTMSWTHSSAGSSRAGARRVRPRSSSALSRSSWPAKLTIQRSWWGRADATVRSPRSVRSTVPGSRRSTRSVVSTTATSPRRPWGRATWPTSSSGAAPCSPSALTARSVLELDLDVAAVAGGGRPDDGADGRGHPAALADHAAHVGGADPHGQAGVRPALGQVDAHRVAVLDQGADQVLEHGPGRGHFDRRGHVGHDVFPAGVAGVLSAGVAGAAGALPL